MYIKGTKDYSRSGEERETGLFAGIVSQDGELRETKSGKPYASASVRAFSRADGTAAFLTIKSFSETDVRRLADLQKGDRILACGTVETREYNGKTYTDMLVDFLLTPQDGGDIPPLQPHSAQQPSPSGFMEIEGDGELPF